MEFTVQEYFSLKRTLRFREDGTFKILILTDPHGGTELHPQLKPGIDAMITAAQPDLVLLGGDLTGPYIGCTTQEELYAYLALIMQIPEQQGIPWAHVFGNHDYNKGLSNEKQQEVFQSFSWCVSKRGPQDIHGVGNYVLPIYHSHTDKVVFQVWGMDTHDDNRCFAQEYGLPEDTLFILPEHFAMGYHSDSIHTDQLIWYFETSKAIEKSLGYQVPGMMYMHIPLPEFCLIPRNPQQTHMTGVMREHVGCNELNPGLFSACLQRGDIVGIFAGHDHLNDFCGQYCGITLGNCAGINYDCGSDDDLRGGRIVEVSQNDPRRIKTYMLHLRDILGERADNHGRS
ncbi:MAG TPA: metallophosphoesterase [Candidatus Gallacutalibacter stercoravium]|nr:metallophosphoesterase [Candidatus Gallacutalibacter stercoravium]